MKTLAVARGLAVALILLAAPGLASPVHAQLTLMKSEPAEGATVQSVSEIRLFFNEEPMAMGPSTVTVRIVDASGTPAARGNAAQSKEDFRVFALPLADGLEPGAYTAMWGTMSEDGENVRGQISFTVGAP